MDFTTLAFLLCARLATLEGQDLVELGKIVAGECQTDYYIGDSYGESVPVYGHKVSVSVTDDGAYVIVDDQVQFLPKSTGA